MVRVNAGVANPEGGAGLPAGIYHVLVKASGMDPKQPNKVKVTFECLAGKTAAGDTVGCVGGMHTEWFEPEDEPGKMSKIFQYAWAVGLITREQWKALHEAKTSLDLPIENTSGKQCCIEIQTKEGKPGTKNAGKMFQNVDYRFFPVWDEKCEHYPKDMNWAQSVPGRLPGAAAPPPAEAAPSATAPAPGEAYGGF
jgi:hypothetical protein